MLKAARLSNKANVAPVDRAVGQYGCHYPCTATLVLVSSAASCLPLECDAEYCVLLVATESIQMTAYCQLQLHQQHSRYTYSPIGIWIIALFSMQQRKNTLDGPDMHMDATMTLAWLYHPTGSNLPSLREFLATFQG